MSILIKSMYNIISIRSIHRNIVMLLAMMIFTFLVLGRDAVHGAPNGDERTACRLPENLEGNINLDPICIYSETIKITKSNVILNCRGALIDVGRRSAFGVEIGGVADVENVVVKDCKVRNATNSGVLIGWRSPASIREIKFDMAQRYAAATKKVTIDGVSAEHNAAAGIYILAYSQEVIIKNSMIHKNEGVGVYIGPHSIMTTVESSVLRGNGFGGRGRPRAGLGRREGIAVDSSGKNVIKNNVFDRNGGGIYMYKNCQEFVSSYGRNFKRTMPSNHNQIVNNRFVGGGPAIWIASRQSRNLSIADCGDEYYGDGRYVIDRSQFNIIFGNSFRSVWIAVIVEDDNNAVLNNKIDDVRFSCIVVGNGPRSTILRKSVMRTLVDRNRCKSWSGGYVFANGADSSGFRKNLLNGRPAEKEINACATNVMPFRGLGVDRVC